MSEIQIDVRDEGPFRDYVVRCPHGRTEHHESLKALRQSILGQATILRELFADHDRQCGCHCADVLREYFFPAEQEGA